MFVNNLYCRALVVSLDEMAKFRGGSGDAIPDCQADANCQDIILAISHDIPGRLPYPVGKYNIEYLDNEGLIGRYSVLGKPFAILKVRPISKYGKRRKISVIRYWINIEQKDVIYSLSDWSNVYFSYDNEKHDYLIDEVEIGGI